MTSLVNRLGPLGANLVISARHGSLDCYITIAPSSTLTLQWPFLPGTMFLAPFRRALMNHLHCILPEDVPSEPVDKNEALHQTYKIPRTLVLAF